MADGRHYSGPRDRLELYENLVARKPHVERKGATMPYTSRNGHMFSFLDQQGAMGLRLSDDDRGRFLVEYDARLAEQYGRVMKEYVAVPDALLARTDDLEVWFERSYAYVGTLRPKPTRR